MYTNLVLRVNFVSFVSTALLTATIFFVVACDGSDKSGSGTLTKEVKSEEPNKSSQSESKALSGLIEIDGSSTVFPISQAVAEEFNKILPDVQIYKVNNQIQGYPIFLNQGKILQKEHYCEMFQQSNPLLGKTHNHQSSYLCCQL